MECAFGRLKGRWRSLLKRNDTDVSFLPTLVTACCVLHNLCEVHGDSFNNDWLTEEDADESTTAQTAAAVQAQQWQLRMHFVTILINTWYKPVYAASLLQYSVR